MGWERKKEMLSITATLNPEAPKLLSTLKDYGSELAEFLRSLRGHFSEAREVQIKESS